MILLLCSISFSAQEDISIDIAIIDQPPQFRDGKSVIVAGLWHNISFSNIPTTETLFLTAHKGTSIPNDKNWTNYFQWQFLPSQQSWNITTIYGENTINPSRCEIDSDTITFCIGIPDSLPDEIFYHEEWTISLSTSTNIIINKFIYLENPTRGFAKSHGDFLSFSVDPFKKMDIQANDYIILKNTGNVPLKISIEYSALDEYLTFIESNEEIEAYGKQNYKITLQSDSWKPQRIQQKGVARAIVSDYYLLNQDITGTSISLQTAFIIDIPTINIFVGHNSYELTILDSTTGFSFQYQKRISMHEGEKTILKAFASGDGTATISIEGNDNISLLDIKNNNQQVQSPFTITSTNEDEQIISLTIKALSENNDGKIIYTINFDGEIQTYNTYIDIGPPSFQGQPNPIQSTSPLTIVVLIILIIAAGYMLYNHLVYGKGERR